MKKLLCLSACVAVLVAFTGVSAAQEKKTVVKRADAPADKVSLSVNKAAKTDKGCPVKAQPRLSSDPEAAYPGTLVNFVDVKNGEVLQSVKSNAKGKAKYTVGWNTTVRAEVSLASDQPPLQSKELACGAPKPAA